MKMKSLTSWGGGKNSTMAHGLRTVPVSTVTPNSAFTLNDDREIVNKTAFKLRGKRMLEMYTCSRDWLHAKTRTQGQRELDDDEISISETGDAETEQDRG